MAAQQKFASLDFVTPVGRLVSGNLSIASDKGYNGAKREKPQYFFALAVGKDDPGIMPLLTNIQNHAWTSYAATQHAAAVHARITSGPIGAQFPPGIQAPFAWKIEDGDAPDVRDREGWAGCWILKFAGIFPIQVANLQNAPIDPASVQLGTYAEVGGSVEINGNADHTAGIYMNYRMVRVVGYGPLIVTGPSAESIFGNRTPTLPPGASLTPVAPAQAMPQAAPAGVPPMGGSAPAPQYQQPQAAPGAQVGHYTPPPAPYQPPVPQGNPQQPTPQYQQPQAPAYAPAVPAGAAPVPSIQGAPTGSPAVPPTYQQPYPATAYPSNQQGTPQPNAYPGVQPHPAFNHGGQ